MKKRVEVSSGVFLSLFHQVMGVKLRVMSATTKILDVSIPFSSGHGGKELRGFGCGAL